ncbi:MAG: hypothetical protein ACYTHJ_08800 [Planctomycetota bacterium]|jgi:hypothetical protein
MNEQAAAIKQHLDALVSSGNPDEFVILEQRGTDQFVQAGMNEEGLFLDLPTQPLSDEQVEKARAYFQRIDGEEGSQGSLDETAFQRSFGGDTDGAAIVVLDIFREVYQLESPDIRAAH